VNLSDNHAKEWLNANEYLYTTWTAGLCDTSVYPVVETNTHPPGSDQVTLRKLGHGAEVTMLSETINKTVDCRGNATSTPLEIKFNNVASTSVKIRGCLDQYACKPYRDCELSMAPGAEETVTFDASFKYFVFTYHEAGKETELYPDANMKYPTDFTIEAPKEALVSLAMLEATPTLVIHQETPGHHSHCLEMSFIGGKNNPYYESHGYQYQLWSDGLCPSQYNWFNNNVTIAKGVVETTLGTHTVH